jgi:short-subunit dehydrogenase
MRIEGRRTVITGASSGIGMWLAAAVAEKRGALVLAARRLEPLERVAERLRVSFPDAPAPVVFPCDVRDGFAVRQLIRFARERAGGVDILINNAGAALYGLTSRTSPDDFRAQFDTNFFGPLYAVLEVIPEMERAGGGMIVNVASVAGLYGVPYLAAYGASKAALAVLGESLRAELATSGIRVLNVYPGYTRTEIFEREKRVGGARRPPGRYTPADRVALAIVRAIEAEKPELVLSTEGKVLARLRGVAPRTVDRAMRRIASRLRVREPRSKAA